MNEIVTINEVRNDGRSIHLYYNGLMGLWTAYGVSAFILSNVTTVNASYSENLQMPVVVINTAHLELVKQKLNVAKYKNGYYCLTVEKAIDKDVYKEWAASLREGVTTT